MASRKAKKIWATLASTRKSSQQGIYMKASDGSYMEVYMKASELKDALGGSVVHLSWLSPTMELPYGRSSGLF